MMTVARRCRGLSQADLQEAAVNVQQVRSTSACKLWLVGSFGQSEWIHVWTGGSVPALSSRYGSLQFC